MRSKPAKRHGRSSPPEEFVGEVVAGPGVVVMGPPTAVPVAPIVESDPSGIAVRPNLPPELARAADAGRRIGEAIVTVADVLDALGLVKRPPWLARPRR